MDSENPYKSPQSDTKPIVSKRAAPLSIRAILFGFEGRIPRRVYWGASLCITFVFYGLVVGLAAAFGPRVYRVVGRDVRDEHPQVVDYARDSVHALARPRQIGLVVSYQFHSDYWTALGVY